MTKEQQGPTSLSKRDSSFYIKRRGCESFLVSVYDFVAITIAYSLWLNQFQACLSPVGNLSGICHFFLRKLQMPHSGTSRFLQVTPPCRLKMRANTPPWRRGSRYDF